MRTAATGVALLALVTGPSGLVAQDADHPLVSRHAGSEVISRSAEAFGEYEARARAVVAALVGDYGVEASRLEGNGVGPLAPVSTNASDEGRQANRWVELVAR